MLLNEGQGRVVNFWLQDNILYVVVQLGSHLTENLGIYFVIF